MARSLPGRRAALVLAIPFAAFLASPFLGVTVAQPWHVVGESMEPSIEDGSVLLVDAVGPLVTGYSRGDIVILDLPADIAYDSRMLVKRIVGLPGDHVVVADGSVVLNGVREREPYLGPDRPGTARAAAAAAAAAAGPPIDVVVPPGTVFVMGDHRVNSFDSKSFGPVSEDRLVGRVWISIAPEGRVELPRAAAIGE